jgi:hypothetical protein
MTAISTRKCGISSYTTKVPDTRDVSPVAFLKTQMTKEVLEINHDDEVVDGRALALSASDLPNLRSIKKGFDTFQEGPFERQFAVGSILTMQCAILSNIYFQPLLETE